MLFYIYNHLTIISSFFNAQKYLFRVLCKFNSFSLLSIKTKLKNVILQMFKTKHLHVQIRAQ